MYTKFWLKLEASRVVGMKFCVTMYPTFKKVLLAVKPDHMFIRGPFAKFVDSPYYSESELCGGAVTVFFEVPPLASDPLPITLHPRLENVRGWKSPQIARGEIWTVWQMF
jgi:hypothetical protein